MGARYKHGHPAQDLRPMPGLVAKKAAVAIALSVEAKPVEAKAEPAADVSAWDASEENTFADIRRAAGGITREEAIQIFQECGRGIVQAVQRALRAREARNAGR